MLILYFCIEFYTWLWYLAYLLPEMIQFEFHVGKSSKHKVEGISDQCLSKNSVIPPNKFPQISQPRRPTQTLSRPSLAPKQSLHVTSTKTLE